MPDYDAGFQVGAKQGTEFLGLDGPTPADLAVDTSQAGQDFETGASWIYEDDAGRSARFNVAYPRTIHARIQIDENDVGFIFRHGDSPDHTRFRINPAGRLVAIEDGSTIGTLDIPNLGAGRRAYEVAWVSVENPDSTGAADEVASWLLLHDVTAVERARAGPFFHSAKPSSDLYAVWGAGTTAGADALTGQLIRVGFHRRAMTLAEIEQDWISTLAAPATSTEVERQGLPIDQASGIGDRDELQGPPHTWAAQNHRALRRRTAGGRHIRMRPLVEISLGYHIAAATQAKVRLAPESTLYRWRIGWLLGHPVPDAVSHLGVRVQVHTWVTAGGSVPIGIRIYSMNRPPTIGAILPPGEEPEPFEQASVGAIIDRDDGAAGVGEYTHLGRLPVMRGTGGLRRRKTYLAIAYAIDPEASTANDANARFTVGALHLSPAFVDPAGGGLGFGGD